MPSDWDVVSSKPLDTGSPAAGNPWDVVSSQPLAAQPANPQQTTGREPEQPESLESAPSVRPGSPSFMGPLQPPRGAEQTGLPGIPYQGPNPQSVIQPVVSGNPAQQPNQAGEFNMPADLKPQERITPFVKDLYQRNLGERPGGRPPEPEEPVVKPSLLLPEENPGESPLVTGARTFTQGIEGMTSRESMSMIAGTAGLGSLGMVGRATQAGIAAYFAAKQAAQVPASAKRGYDLFQQGDTNGAFAEWGMGSAQLGMAMLAAAAAKSGGEPVVRAIKQAYETNAALWTAYSPSGPGGKPGGDYNEPGPTISARSRGIDARVSNDTGLPSGKPVWWGNRWTWPKAPDTELEAELRAKFEREYPTPPNGPPSPAGHEPITIRYTGPNGQEQTYTFGQEPEPETGAAGEAPLSKPTSLTERYTLPDGRQVEVTLPTEYANTIRQHAPLLDSIVNEIDAGSLGVGEGAARPGASILDQIAGEQGTREASGDVMPELLGQKPPTATQPEAPPPLEQPSAASAPTAQTPTTPESPDTLALQLDQLKTGQRRVVMFPSGTPLQKKPKGMALYTDEQRNVYIYNPALVTTQQIDQAAQGNQLPQLLGSTSEGMGAPDKSQLQGPAAAVVGKTPEGVTAQATVTDQPHLPQAIAATEQVTPPNGTVEVEPPEQVIQDRVEEQPAQHDYSSTQVNIPPQVAEPMQRFAAAIPPDKLTKDGAEDDSHITLKYGLETANPDDVRKLLENEPPITATLGKTSLFENDDADVLKVDITSPDLDRLNRKVAESLPNSDTHPVYQPHATIAYLKPGQGKQYAGKEIPGVTGQTVTFNSVRFSGKNGVQVDIPLSGKPRAAQGVTETPQIAHDNARSNEPATPEPIEGANKSPGKILNFEQGRDLHLVKQAKAAAAKLRSTGHDTEEIDDGIEDLQDIVARGPDSDKWTQDYGTNYGSSRDIYESVLADAGQQLERAVRRAERVLGGEISPDQAGQEWADELMGSRNGPAAPPQPTAPEPIEKPAPLPKRPMWHVYVDDKLTFSTPSKDEALDRAAAAKKSGTARKVAVGKTKAGQAAPPDISATTQVSGSRDEPAIPTSLEKKPSAPTLTKAQQIEANRKRMAEIEEQLRNPKEAEPEAPEPIEKPVPTPTFKRRTVEQQYDKFKKAYDAIEGKDLTIPRDEYLARNTGIPDHTARIFIDRYEREKAQAAPAPAAKRARTPKRGNLSPLEAEILQNLDETRQTHLDKILGYTSRWSRTPDDDVIAALFTMEMAGLVKQMPGKNFVRTPGGTVAIGKEPASLENPAENPRLTTPGTELQSSHAANSAEEGPKGLYRPLEPAAPQSLESPATPIQKPAKAKPPRLTPPRSHVEPGTPLEPEPLEIPAEQPIIEMEAGHDRERPQPGEPERPGTLEATPAEDGNAGDRGQPGRTDDGHSGRPGAAGDGLQPGAGDQPADRLPAGRRGRTRAARQPRTTPAHDYRITDRDHLGEGGQKEKARANLEAIRVLKQIEEDGGRPATPEEQARLVKYVGWGSLSQAFDNYRREWDGFRAELEGILTPEEYASARASTKNAHYTSPTVVRGMWRAMEHLGFRKGEDAKTLETSAGIGHFLGMMPENLRDAMWTAVELDSLTGRIAKLLYPSANVQIAKFQKAALPNNYFDVAISNVPFGKYGVHDAAYKRHPFITRSIHDYFFAKGLDKVRPGGIVAFVTSSFSMDKKDAMMRKYLASKADLLGAIRLPGGKEGAFAQNAGTEVTTDIIFLRKRDPQTEAAGERWEGLAEVDGADENGKPTKIQVNEYYARHPEMMLGQMAMQGTMHGPEKSKVLLGELTPEKLDAAIDRLPRDVYEEYHDTSAVFEQNPIHELPNAGDIKDGAYGLKDDTVIVRKGNGYSTANVSASQAERIKGLMEVRDKIREVFRTQLSTAGESPDVAAARKELNHAYDKFVKKHGPVNSKENAKAYFGDPDAPLAAGLEDYDRQTNTAKKRDIFHKRVIGKYTPPEHADQASDALAITLAEAGRIDWMRMQDLTGKTPDEMREELADLIFQNPEGQAWETADEYLCGNVRAKLAIAKTAAATNPDYDRNVRALEAAQPKDLTPRQINARLGASWIPTDDIRDFIAHLVLADVDSKWQRDDYLKAIKVGHAGPLGTWSVALDDSVAKLAANTNKWGFGTYAGADLIEKALNLQYPKIYTMVGDGKDAKRVLDKVATLGAQEKQDKIKAEFKKWLWSDAQRAERLARLYNDQFNNLRLREYDGKHLTFPGMAKLGLRNGDLDPHQKAAVWRMIQGGNTLLAHVVGAGKTFEMIAAGMEMKRMGKIKKPLYVVPNHLVEQWGKDFLRLYPGANIFIAGKDYFTTGNRQEAMSRIATGNYDAVIVAHRSFQFLPVSDGTFTAFMTEQLHEIDEALKEAEAQEAEEEARTTGYGRRRGKKRKTHTVKQLEAARARIEKAIEDRANREETDKTLNFEELGVDQIFVDEAHMFKNLYYATKMTRVAGLPNSQSNRAMDMFIKTQYLTRLHNGKRGVVFATGTPISNTMAEMFTMQRYLQNDYLKEAGISSFDSWAQNFGEAETGLELAPEGTGYRMNTRFSRFINLPELLTAFRTVADVKNAEDLKLPRPEMKTGKPIIISVPSTPELRAKVQELGERAEAIRSGRVTPDEDNMLAIVGEGRKGALDMRLLNPSLPDDPGSKVNRAVEEIASIWKDTKPQLSTQLVFLDLGTPRGASEKKHKKGEDEGESATPGSEDSQATSVYADIRKKLLKRGIPAAEIKFIHDAKDDAAKQQLFDDVNAGRVRILLGSTEKMGAGMNVQKKLAALHHLDAPWRPSDVEQRDGRGLRQGNENKEIAIYRYVTEDSFDAYMWQTILSKTKTIAQAMSGDLSVREIEDTGVFQMSAAEAMAAASGSPEVRERIGLQMEVQRLAMLEEAHRDAQRQARWETEHLPGQLKWEKQERADLEQTIAGRNAFGEANPWTVRGFKGKEAGDRNRALLEAARELKGSEGKLTIGSYKGLPIVAHGRGLYHYETVEVDAEGAKHRIKHADPLLPEITIAGLPVDFRLREYAAEKDVQEHARSLSVVVRNRLDIEPDHRVSYLSEQIAKQEKRLQDLQSELHTTFEHGEKLRKLEARLEELDKKLNIGHTDTQAVEMDDESQPAKPTQPEQDEGFLSGESGASSLEMALVAPLVPALKEAAVKAAEMGDAILKATAPALRGDAAKRASMTLREHLAEKQRQYDLAMKAMEPAYKAFARIAVEAEKGDEAARTWILDFYDRAEKGEPQENPELDAIAKVFHGLFNQRTSDVRALGTGALRNAIENYLPHLYKEPDKAKPILEQLMMERYARRPMQGSKAWQKQRSIDFLKEAYCEHKLEPLSWNPIDLVTERLVLMDKYIMAHRVLQELKADPEKIVRFVRATEKPPAGYRRIDDAIATVYGPPVVKVKEAYDKAVTERLNELASSLGIKHERKVRVGGRRLGYAEKSGSAEKPGKVVTKFASPESVLAHEIGHQLEWKYNLTSLLRGAPDRTGKDRAAITKELRALADLRYAGQDAPESFRKYVRSRDEKMANAIAALIYAPELFKKTAPETWDFLRDELWHIPALKPLFEIKPSMLLDTRTAEVPVGGLVKAGEYYAVEPVARVINNHLGPGLRNSEISGPFYRFLMGGANWMNQFTLSMSGFHAGFTSFEANTSQLALAIYQAMRGQYADAGKSFVHWIPQTHFISAAVHGRKGVAEWDHPGSQDAEIGKVLNALKSGGFRAHMDSMYRTNMRAKLAQAWWASGWPGFARPFHPKVALRFVPAFVEKISSYTLEKLVPYQKTAVAMALMSSELERLGPEATHEEIRQAAAKITDSVDNRLGQMAYDNLFWDRTFKDIAMLTVRSVGWNLGTWRELAGGAADWAKYGFQAAAWATSKLGHAYDGPPPGGGHGGGTGGAGEGGSSGSAGSAGMGGGGPQGPKAAEEAGPEATMRMAYTLALPVQTILYGAILTYLFTGKGPRDVKDYFFPPDGTLDEHGNPNRWNVWGYAKDVVHTIEHPVSTAAAKLQPYFVRLAEEFANRDFWTGEQVRNAEDPWVKRWIDSGKFWLKGYTPYSALNVQREVEEGADWKHRLLPLAGLTPASASSRRTPAQDLYADYMQGHREQGGRTHEQQASYEARLRIIRDMRSGRDISADLTQALRQGLIVPREIPALRRAAHAKPMSTGIRELTPEQALNLYAHASEAERAQLFAPIRKHLMSRKPGEWTERSRNQATRYFGLRPRMAGEPEAPEPLE